MYFVINRNQYRLVDRKQSLTFLNVKITKRRLQSNGDASFDMSLFVIGNESQAQRLKMKIAREIIAYTFPDVSRIELYEKFVLAASSLFNQVFSQHLVTAKYPLNLWKLLIAIKKQFSAKVWTKPTNNPKKVNEALHARGNEILREAIIRATWYPIGIMCYNEKLWCKHGNTKYACRTCQMRALCLVKRHRTDLGFPPKDVMKLIFNRLPFVDLRDVPYGVVVEIEHLCPVADIDCPPEEYGRSLEPEKETVCGAGFFTMINGSYRVVYCGWLATHQGEAQWRCKDHIDVCTRPRAEKVEKWVPEKLAGTCVHRKTRLLLPYKGYIVPDNKITV